MSHSDSSSKETYTLEVMLREDKIDQAKLFIEKNHVSILYAGDPLSVFLASRFQFDLLKWCIEKGFASRFDRTIKDELSLVAVCFAVARSEREEMKPKLTDELVGLAEFLDFPSDQSIVRDAIDTFVQQYASEASKKIFFKSSDMSLGETSSDSDSLSDSGSDSLPDSDSSSAETPFVLLRDSEKDATRGLRRRNIPASIDPH